MGTSVISNQESSRAIHWNTESQHNKRNIKHGTTNNRYTTKPSPTEPGSVQVTPENISTTKTVPGDRLQPQPESAEQQDHHELPGHQTRGHGGGLQEAGPASLARVRHQGDQGGGGRGRVHASEEESKPGPLVARGETHEEEAEEQSRRSERQG